MEGFLVRVKFVFVVLLCVFLTGCFEIEQSINLQKDLSGTADFHMGIDMEPMIVIMAQVGREMEGKKGPISAAELAKAKADFKKQQKDKKSDPAPDRKEMEKDLPPGVKLLDFKATEKEFGVAMDMKFGFDKVAHLIGVKMPQKEGGDPTSKNVMDTPFEGLQVIEKGGTITVQTKPANPAEKVNEEAAQQGGPKIDPEMEKMMKDAFAKMRVVYRLTAPFTIVSHNATRKEGNTLIWEYDMKRFEELAKSKKDDFGVKVVYRR
ncbi:MAG: hypothetical protein DMF56_16755 [Acidobacteria bacterium]|nr:MAG: hypothetical protein DMF56_16755 [Acidobacteriota bacterium]